LNNNPPSIKEPVSLHIGLWSNGLPTKSSDVIEQKRLKDARGGHPVEEVGVPTWQIKLNEPIRRSQAARAVSDCSGCDRIPLVAVLSSAP